jgi:hypothetical protein
VAGGAEFDAVMEEAARYRELDRLMSISLPRDGLPIAWRATLRFMLIAFLIERCGSGDVGALLLMALLRRSGIPLASGG